MATKTANQIIADLTKVLQESDGETIARIANDILPEQVTYVGDSLFEVESDEIESLYDGEDKVLKSALDFENELFGKD